jgi:hypothetical protein
VSPPPGDTPSYTVVVLVMDVHQPLCPNFLVRNKLAIQWRLLLEARAFSVTGAQRLTEHLQDALQDLTAVRQQENDLLKRRVDLCHQELEDQIAELERSFHLKVKSMSMLDSLVACLIGSGAGSTTMHVFCSDKLL